MSEPLTTVVATTASQAVSAVAGTAASQPWWLAADGPWWVDPLATVLGIIVGAYMILVQQRRASSAELKLKVFEEIQRGLSAASSAVTSAGIWAFSAPGNVERFFQLLHAQQNPALPRSRTLEFFDLHAKASEATTDLISSLESYGIVSEHFELYRRALACAINDVRDAHTRLVPLLFRVLPFDPPPGMPGNVQMPNSSETDQRAFRAACENYWQMQSTVSNYIHDIKGESQNVLLGGIFKRRVPPRDPPDKTLWVLRTDDSEYLKRVTKWFMEDHPAAARARQLDAELREENKGIGKYPG
jgi:hypothetical protein